MVRTIAHTAGFANCTAVIPLVRNSWYCDRNTKGDTSAVALNIVTSTQSRNRQPAHSMLADTVPFPTPPRIKAAISIRPNSHTPIVIKDRYGIHEMLQNMKL